MIIPAGRRMFLFTVNVSPAMKTRINNVVYAENAARSLTGLGLRPFQPPRHPSFSPCQAWFVQINGLIFNRFENDLTLFADVAAPVESLDICRRVAYALKQSMGMSGASINSNDLAVDMDLGDNSSIIDPNPDIGQCSYSSQPYDLVLAQPVTSTGFIESLTTHPTTDSSNPSLNNTRIGPTLTQQVRNGIVAATSEQTANTLYNLAHNTANAGRSLLGDINDGVAGIAGSSELIKFAVYGLVIYGVVSATTKLIQTVK